jgi:protein SCO1/2
MMNRKLVWVGVGLLIFVAIAAVAAGMLVRPSEYYATVYQPKAAPEISLPRPGGGQFHLHDLRGKVVLLFFSYINCMEICPTIMGNLTQAVSELGADAERVQVVYITVDPQRDTPELAQQYASGFDPSFIGLSGSPAELETVWKDYGIYREAGMPGADGSYEVIHTARVTVIDPQGNLRLSINSDSSWQDIVRDLQLLLDEG